jgi:hypothetical protein
MITARSTGDAVIRATFVEPPLESDFAVCPARTYFGVAYVHVKSTQAAP